MLFKLSESFGVSGNEYGLSDIIEEGFKDYTDEVIHGKLGQVIAIKKGTGVDRLKVMIAAHSDEIGMVVTDIDDRGFVHFTSAAGVDAKTIPAQEVIIHGRNDIYGVVGAKPPHVLTSEEVKKAVKMQDMRIDTGLDRDELVKQVSVGDFITVKRNPVNLIGDFITGKALDDRAGICAMYECAKKLDGLKHSCDVYFTSTTMEERGSMGARTSTYAIEPDIAIAVDVTFGDKYASSNIECECGKEIEITVGPNIHRELSKKLRKVAKDNRIDYKLDVAAGHTGTDAWVIQTSKEGIPTLLISIPLRYMHTSTEVISYRDVEAVGKLMALFIAEIKSWGDIYA